MCSICTFYGRGLFLMYVQGDSYILHSHLYISALYMYNASKEKKEVFVYVHNKIEREIIGSLELWTERAKDI